MDCYIGCKIVKAEPMDYHDFLMKIKKVEKEDMIYQNHNQEGYKVEYEDNYISWSPKEVFERCYRKIEDSEKKLTES